MLLYLSIFCKIIVTAIFPIAFILLLFSIPYYWLDKKRLLRPLSFVLLLFLGLILGLLVYAHLMGNKFPIRYTYILIYPSIILSIPGFFVLINLINKYLPSKYSSRKYLVPIILLLVISVSCIGKALSPPSIKISTESVTNAIFETANGNNFILITDYEPNTFSMFMRPHTVLDADGVINRKSLQAFSAELKEFKEKYNCQIFISLRIKDSDFKAGFGLKGEKFPLEVV